MKPYNPLEKENLGKSVIQSLLQSEPHSLASIRRFPGAGVYAIYYLGDFDAYGFLKNWNPRLEDLHLPIYVGKAIPAGGRKGIVCSEKAANSSALFKRLDEHRRSIIEAANLSITDFVCRHLVVDDVWIPLGESLLIQSYKPLWNAVVEGFGNHTPGRGRFAGACSSWDTLHPGRSWVAKCGPSKHSEADIRTRIDKFAESFEGPVLPW